MTWIEFKNLTREEQQAFIDEMGRRAPVNGAALARYFGVSTPTVTRYLNAHHLFTSRKNKEMVIPQEIRAVCEREIRDRTVDGSLPPSLKLKTEFLKVGIVPALSLNNTRSTLQATLEIEIALGKDLCQFTTEDYKVLFDTHFGMTPSGNRNALASIKKYVEFCDRLGAPASKDIFTFIPDFTQKIRERMVASPIHLAITLDQVFDPISAKTLDVLYRAAIWLSFSGVSQKDISAVKISDIDFTSQKLTFEERSYRLYSESLEAFRVACLAEEFALSGARSTETRKRIESDKLLRGVRSATIQTSTLSSAICHKMHESGLNMSYETIKLSGHFYRAYELERIGYKPDFADIISERVSDGRIVTEQSLRVMASEIKRQYEAWKKAFS